MLRVLAVVVALAVPGAAFAKPTVLRLQQSSSESIHLAQGEGAINRRAALAVQLTLDGKAARVVATGTDTDGNLFVSSDGSSYTTKDASEWTTTWAGSVRYANHKLHLDLMMQQHQCKHWQESSGQPVDQLACKAPTARALITCHRDQLTVHRDEHDAAGTAVRLWRCDPEPLTELAETASHWDLGLTTCLERVGGRGLAGGASFRFCGTP